MTVKELLSQLKSLANEKMVALNIRNGAGKNQFGVKLGDIRTIAAKIKTDHALGLHFAFCAGLDQGNGEEEGVIISYVRLS